MLTEGVASWAREVRGTTGASMARAISIANATREVGDLMTFLHRATPLPPNLLT
jgi:hypothetical protein